MTKILSTIYNSLGVAAVAIFGCMTGINLLQRAWGSAVMNLGITILYIGLYVLIVQMGWK